MCVCVSISIHWMKMQNYDDIFHKMENITWFNVGMSGIFSALFNSFLFPLIFHFSTLNKTSLIFQISSSHYQMRLSMKSSSYSICECVSVCTSECNWWSRESVVGLLLWPLLSFMYFVQIHTRTRTRTPYIHNYLQYSAMYTFVVFVDVDDDDDDTLSHF